MTRQLWLNLPVKDVALSREFFTKMGFPLNPHYGNGTASASFLVGEKQTVLMLFPEETFKSFTRNELPDPHRSTQMLLSIDAESREEVDEMAKRAREAGGTVYAEPSENQGWMYGCGFADLDGHRWNVLYMDMSKLPKS